MIEHLVTTMSARTNSIIAPLDDSAGVAMVGHTIRRQGHSHDRRRREVPRGIPMNSNLLACSADKPL